MVNAFTRSPSIAVLDAIIDQEYLLVQRISHRAEGLREMLQKYRDDYGIKEPLDTLDNAIWYASVNCDGKLLSAVGLEENYNSRHGLWLFVRDFVCEESRAGLIGLGEIVEFMDRIPYMMRGAVAANNPKMRKRYLSHGEKNRRVWKKIYDIVETEKL